ncbi:PQQ-binding-like beta-propeller repeat protein [Phytohabitans sp. ZYX-F-186]|uniref:PQQ-binding-like beta-propeller repeat protein n=1 Tax=Phytohabitans maris TaxID=3071409 RepID=A0ABU0ZIE5_9ACTN|nr:PQQ-binding-like beta-propeller repeat protein [Phytohabitans sp. ZYX-F-186]MDQ7906829.1 PQQ-binding-like beta-propeller repeat protein [Phytohabitans sp. ZYX-F-186]
MTFRAFRFSVLGLVAALLPAAPALAAAVSAVPERTPTFDGVVWATAYDGDTVYVGGDFTAAVVSGRSIPRARLAAFDARTGALRSWAPSADGRVRAIAVSGGSVYVAGEFGRISGVRRDNLARLDAVTGGVRGGLVHSVSGQPYALATGDGRLYVGGTISAVDGEARSRLAAFDLRGGALDLSWRPAADGTVQAVVASGDRVYVGGKFGTVDGVAGSARLAALHPVSGTVDLSFRPTVAEEVRGLAVGGSSVYAAHGGQGGRVAAYDSGGGSRWRLTMDGDPQAIAVLDGVVYFGGHFDHVCRSPQTGANGTCLEGSIGRVKLGAAATGDGHLLPWTANANGVEGVHALAASGRLDKVAAGGAFTKINGVAQPYFAQFSQG